MGCLIATCPDASAAGDGAAANPPYRLVPKAARRVKASLTYEVKGPKLEAEEWAAYVAQLPELPGQVDVRTTLSPPGRAARELSELGRPVIFTRILVDDETGRHGLTVRIDCEATLIERALEPLDVETGRPSVPALDPRSRKLALASTRDCDHQSPAFRAWLDRHQLRRKPEENDVDYARRAFVAVRQAIQHVEGPNLERTASGVCGTGESDYAGITAVYVAALRASGIPARVLVGRIVLLGGQPAKGNFAHAKVEFHVKNVGWIPADIAGAIRKNRSSDGLESFGHDTAEFITTHVDTDIVVDTFFGRRTIERLPDVSWWVRGGGSFEGSETRVNPRIDTETLALEDVMSRRNPAPAAKKGTTKTGSSRK